MEPLFTLLTVLIGLLLRMGLPLGATALIVWLLRKLDARWQAEAREARRQALFALAQAQPGAPCWTVRNCPEALRARCSAYARRDIPCWQLFRDPQGHLKPACLDCEVFRNASALALA